MAKDDLLKEQIEGLERLILKHRDLYYNDEAEISDDEYDALEARLVEIDPDNEVIKETGSAPKKRKVKLPYVLGSLKNYGTEDIMQWMAKQDDSIVTSHKLDGVSIFARWINGELNMLTTKGDASIGEDCMFKASKFKGLPTEIDESGEFCARGEALIIGKIPGGYKTRRSAVSGILHRDDLRHADKIHIRFYELIKCKKIPALESSRLKRLEKTGLDVVKFSIITPPEIEKRRKQVIDFLTSEIEKKTTLDYDMDGMVLTKNHTPDRENVKFPKLRVAFKIDTAGKSTKITHIENNVTRTGKLVPIMHLDIIEIDGVEISHPTGHNYDYVKRKKIGVGAEVEVVRSGDAIPYIKEVIKPSNKISIPKKCPECESILKRKGVDVICDNSNCPGRKYAQIEYFIRTLGAENISMKTLKNLNIKTIRKFYTIEEKDIADTPGFGEQSAKIYGEERHKTLISTPEKLLTAFGIGLVGYKNAKKIIDAYYDNRSFHMIFKEPKEKLFNRLYDLDGIGVSIAESLSENIGNFKKTYAFLRKVGFRFEEIEKTNRLKGKSFQFTGKMEKSREEMEELTLNNGGRVSNVNNNLNYLVVADKNTGSTKAKKARELNIKIITEQHFMKLLNL